GLACSGVISKEKPYFWQWKQIFIYRLYLMRQWIDDTAVDGKERVELICGVDPFCFCVEAKLFGIAFEIEVPLGSKHLQFLEVFMGDDFIVDLLGTNSCESDGDHRTQVLNLIYRDGLRGNQILYDLALFDVELIHHH